MKTHISKTYRDGKHVGWKKTVAGRAWFLGYGVSASDESLAIKLAEGLQAKWQLAKLGGASGLTQTDFNEVKALVSGRATEPLITRPTAPPPSGLPPEVWPTPLQPSATPFVGPRQWLFESIDVFVGTLKRQVKPDNSNADHLLASCERISRAKSGIADMPLDALRRKELDDWLAYFGARPPALTHGKPIGPVTIRNVTQAIRMFLSQCAEWEWWTAPPLWERAFKPYTIQRLSTDAEKRERRKRPETHTLVEKRVLWHHARPLHKALIALADWAGHTQTEIATLRFEEVQDDGVDMYVDRHRHKTGVQGRWWIPPEPAAAIREVIATTPRDAAINPLGLALLTPHHNPLVHRASKNQRAKTDYVGQEWSTLLRWVADWGVRPISFKYMRKGTAQMVRDRSKNKELSKVFCAHALDDVQDVHYSRPSLDELETHIRGIYEEMKSIYGSFSHRDYTQIVAEVHRSTGAIPPGKAQSAA